MSENNRYNPHRLFVGSFVPNWLLSREEVSANAKLIFARLAQYAGEGGQAFPFQKTLCKEVGLPDSTTRRALTELVNFKLIESCQQGLGKPNSYFFLKHAWMNSAIQIERTGLLASEQTGLPIHKQTVCSPVSKVKEENQLRESRKRKPRCGTRPNLADVDTFFCNDLHLGSSEGASFFYHYEANGWTQNGGKPICDWKAAARGWALRKSTFGKQATEKRNASISDDSVWKGDIWDLCRRSREGEVMEDAFISRKLTKALQYASRLSIMDYIAQEFLGLPTLHYDTFHAAMMKLPCEGTKIT